MIAFGLASIIERLRPELSTIEGDVNRTIHNFAAFTSASTSDTLTFYTGNDAIPSNFSGAVFCRPRNVPLLRNPAAVFLCTDSPRLLMIRAMNFALPRKCDVSEDKGHVTVGERVIIHHTAAIGGRGFGFERNASGALEAFPHVGGVLIGDDVEIRAHVTVDRGTFTNTVIGTGTKIDHGAYIAHNAQIGRHSLIMAGAIICGSARVGDYCWISPSATVRDGVLIGDGAVVGLGAVVVADVSAGATVFGVPAKPPDC